MRAALVARSGVVFGVVALLVLATAPVDIAWAQARPAASAVPALPAAVPAASGDPRTLNLTQLGLNYAIKLRGVSGTVGIPFSVRADELVTAASLRLNYAFSPSLIPALSHLKVSVNDVEVTTLPYGAAEAGKPQTVDIPIDRRLITDFNRINIELVAHYTNECEDPDHSSLWATVDASSALTLNVTPLKVTSDLATLPQPFFDRRDVRRASIPFVFAGASASAASTTAALGAAGIVSSWLGGLAGYRGATFPVTTGELPTAAHAVVFATPESSIAGLILPAIKGPTLTVVDHPRDPAFKLLLVMGRNAAELTTAASALALNSRAFTGATSTIADLQLPAPRKPHDAPRWISSDRAVMLGELAPGPVFSVSGYTPEVVKVDLLTPPDLFTWRSRGIPLDLHYRYTPRVRPDQSTLNLSVNDTFIGSLPLRAANMASDAWWNVFALKLLPEGSALHSTQLHLPPLAMGSRSQLRMHYYFEQPRTTCTPVLDNVRGGIDPTSTIDVSSFPHYIAMPELAAYANGGFPFSRMADLAETAVVMPDRAERGDIETYLALMGHIGDVTGYPALRVTVGSASNVDQWADKDLLVLGNLKNQPLFTQWAAQMPLRRDPAAAAGPGAEQFHIGTWFEDTLNLIQGSRQREDLPTSTTQMSVFEERTDAVLAGFQSPLRAGRSVVAVVANEASQPALVNALLTPDLLQHIQGSMSIVRSAQVSSLLSGETYYVGTLPPFTWLQWNLSRSPLLLAGLIVLFALLGAGVSFASLQLLARKRLRRQ
jgi:hypothetical protein